MAQYRASLKNEWSKLLSRKKYVVFLILELLFCALTTLVKVLTVSVTDGTVTQSVAFGGMNLSMLSFLLQIYLPLIIFMAVCDLFSTEASDGTLRASFMMPVTRIKVFASKVTAVFLLCICYMLVLFIVTSVIQVMMGGKGDLLMSLASYLIDLIPLLVLIFFAALLNQVTHSSSLAFFLCILLYAGLLILGTFVPHTSGLLFTGYSQWHNLWLGTMLPVTAMLPKIGLLAGYAILFFAGGYLLFERQEV